MFVECSGDFGETCGRAGMKRCFQCNGRFGLIRYRYGLQHFCSQRCVNKYKSDTERKISRIKEWTVFLAQKN